jgi:hypothetical protein
MINHNYKALLFIWIYIYREKKVFYNIEGQLRGFQGSNKLKTCARYFNAMQSIVC